MSNVGRLNTLATIPKLQFQIMNQVTLLESVDDPSPTEFQFS
jgi:hypothetical protein